MNALNAQLMQSDKLAALGKMAAGLAHEINNPLAVIIQKTGWMEDLLAEEDFQKSKNIGEFKTSIKKIEEHVERARKVVHNMLGYARKMEPRLEDVDVNDTVRQTISLLDNYARINNIEIETELSQELPILASDQAQLQQVFLNLISNAIDAIGKDGRIVVKSARAGSELFVSVSDNGKGIAEELQKKVFDPFFTTKASGKGTGLGLWISYTIIERMGGTISLRSKVGEGSTFSVRLPIVTPERK
jgi:two-component system NtrC family sensor kinase